VRETIPPPEVIENKEDRLIIIKEPDVIHTAFIENDPDIDEIGETFEEFAKYVMENCDYDCEPQQNLCIVCGVDIGESNPRQYCMKTYCPEMAG
jgi:hypothetical protein